MRTYLKNYVIAAIIGNIVLAVLFNVGEVCTTAGYNFFWATVVAWVFTFSIYCDKYNSKNFKK